jgi:hypothetical protein
MIQFHTIEVELPGYFDTMVYVEYLRYNDKTRTIHKLQFYTSDKSMLLFETLFYPDLISLLNEKTMQLIINAVNNHND